MGKRTTSRHENQGGFYTVGTGFVILLVLRTGTLRELDFPQIYPHPNQGVFEMQHINENESSGAVTSQYSSPRRKVQSPIKIARPGMKGSSRIRALVAACLSLFLASCGSLERNLVAATVVAGQAPAHELEQVYYLGVFDPSEQVEPTIYRVRVHGQASAMSSSRFASGWVPADVVDSLSSSINFDNGTVQITGQEAQTLPTLSEGRQLMLFGPEGFREAPDDHRLVILMGSSPEEFFNSVNQSLGQLNQHRVSQRSAGLEQELLTAMLKVRDHVEGLQLIERSLSVSVQGGER